MLTHVRSKKNHHKLYEKASSSGFQSRKLKLHKPNSLFFFSVGHLQNWKVFDLLSKCTTAAFPSLHYITGSCFDTRFNRIALGSLSLKIYIYFQKDENTSITFQFHNREKDYRRYLKIINFPSGPEKFSNSKKKNGCLRPHHCHQGFSGEKKLILLCLLVANNSFLKASLLRCCPNTSLVTELQPGVFISN